MKKRLISGLLTATLLLGLALPVSAAQAGTTEDEAAQVLAALNIMTGDENGELQLSRAVTRAEFTKLTVAASVYADSVGDSASTAPYPDVPKAAWFAPYVQAAKEKSLVRGNTRGVFEPGREITLVEGATLALRLLGYQDSDFSGAWGAGQMAMYRALGLNENITLNQSEPMTRRDTLWLFYNLLTAKNQGGQVYLTTLGHPLTPAGEIDRVALINAAMEGPLVAEGSWKSGLPFDVSRAKVYRAGAASTRTAIQSSDIVYWSKSMRTVWAYTGKATGAIQGLTPSATAPTAVTLNGQSYPIESASAAFALSDLGSFRTGDVVTLLLGRTGGVAAVRTPGGSADTVYAIVTALGTGTYRDAEGKSFVADTLTLTATDGESYTYQWENKSRGLAVGNLVQVSLSSAGVDIKLASRTPLTGRVSADGRTVGAYTLAPDVEILDTYGKTTAGKIYPARLAGMDLTDGMVRLYTLNTTGEISRLVLNDGTGDLHRYGVLTKVDEVDLGKLFMSSYTYDVGGLPGLYTTDQAIWNLETGPCQIRSDGGGVERIYNLTARTLSFVGNGKAVSEGRDYTLADGAPVYELRDRSYYLTDLSRVNNGSFTLTGWQDKAETAGGRIRVIVAQAK